MMWCGVVWWRKIRNRNSLGMSKFWFVLVWFVLLRCVVMSRTDVGGWSGMECYNYKILNYLISIFICL